MCPNQEYLHEFYKMFQLDIPALPRKRVEDFIMSHVSMDITHFRGPHSVRELRANAAWTKGSHSGEYEDCSLQVCMDVHVYT